MAFSARLCAFLRLAMHLIMMRVSLSFHIIPGGLFSRPASTNRRELIFAASPSRMEEMFGAATSSSTSREGPNENSLKWVEAASSVTKETCSILGTKCVGVDYGLVRTGIAASVGYSPQPLAILSNLNATELGEEVVKIARSEQAKRIIVGLPLHKNGTEAEQSNITRVFAAGLARQVLKGLGPKVPVYMWDERYSSKEAAARAHARNPNLELYGLLDADAACIILENYYQDNGKDAELIEVDDPEFREQCTLEWKQRLEEEKLQIQQAQSSLEARRLWRKKAMEQDRQAEQHEADRSISSGKKKKRKKKKR